MMLNRRCTRPSLVRAAHDAWLEPRATFVRPSATSGAAALTDTAEKPAGDSSMRLDRCLTGVIHSIEPAPIDWLDGELPSRG